MDYWVYNLSNKIMIKYYLHIYYLMDYMYRKKIQIYKYYNIKILNLNHLKIHN